MGFGGLEEFFMRSLEPVLKERALDLIGELRRSIRSHEVELEIEEVEPDVYKVVALIRPKRGGADAEED